MMKQTVPPDLQLAFDVGHSSIGWAVLETRFDQHPNILGCGAVTFGADDCLASKRRDFRRQRRHIRSTKRRIQRIEQLLAHLGVMSAEALKNKHTQAGGHAAPWLLAARVLASNGEAKHLLDWPQLWDVLRWYAHNRGYDGNRRWSNAEADDGDEDTEKEENAKKLMQSHGATTMAETFCKELRVDPFGAKQSSEIRFKGLNAAFPRAVVEKEVHRILQAHFGKLPQLDATFERALMDDARLLPCPAFKLAKRFDGGLLFGQSVPRFDNRIIANCPVSGGKVCAKTAPEFLHYRWLMQLANVRVVRPEPTLSKAERAAIHAQMQAAGAFTPGEFEKAIADLTGKVPNNLKTMLMHPDAAKALVLDPVQKLIRSDRVQFLWPHLPERIQKRAKGKWRNGEVLTLRQLLTWCDETGSPSAAILQAARDAVAAKEAGKKPGKAGKAKKPDDTDPLDAALKTERLSGRAPYARHILKQAAEEVLDGFDPRKKSKANDPLGGEGKPQDGCLVTTDSMTDAALKKPLDQLTNNHLVRHRLLILQRLTADIVADPTLCGGSAARIGSIAIEVNSELKEMSGKTAKAVAQDLGLRLGNFKSVVKKLEDAGIHDPAPGIIRKARVAEDLNWFCPYSGRKFDPLHLLDTEKWDKDHIIPYSERPSNSLDSLVITTKGINLAKKKRTALQFIEEMNRPENLAERDRLGVWTPKQFKDFVDGLESWKGHDDDVRRKRRRKQLLLLPKWEEKDAGFLPRDLTVTSHLTRLGALVLRRSLPHLEPHRITSLPGSVTGTIRTGWKLLGCLAAGNPGVLEANGDVKTKTDIRGITHLHHALDAIVIGLTHHYFPKNGRLWEAMVRREKQRTAEDNALLLATGLYQQTQHGVLFAKEPPRELVNQLRARLAERRVIQYIPAGMGGLKAEQNTWRVLDVKNGIAKLRQQMRGPDGKKQPEKNADEKAAKLVGLVDGKLSALKGALVIGDNYGLAILDNATDEKNRLAVIPWHKVWHRINELKEKNGGKIPRVLRNGMLIHVPNGKFANTWTVRSIKSDRSKGELIDMAATDIVTVASKGNAQRRDVRVRTLLRDGLEILKTPLTGIADNFTSLELESGSLKSS
jgi:CRISPR-associated endonuclease Csn1